MASGRQRDLFRRSNGGLARRMGRGGQMLLDRSPTPFASTPLGVAHRLGGGKSLLAPAAAAARSGSVRRPPSPRLSRGPRQADRVVAGWSGPVDEAAAEVAVVGRRTVGHAERWIRDQAPVVCERPHRVVTDRGGQERALDGIGWAAGREEALDVPREGIEEPRAGWRREDEAGADGLGTAAHPTCEREI